MKCIQLECSTWLLQHLGGLMCVDSQGIVLPRCKQPAGGILRREVALVLPSASDHLVALTLSLLALHLAKCSD